MHHPGAQANRTLGAFALTAVIAGCDILGLTPSATPLPTLAPTPTSQPSPTAGSFEPTATPRPTPEPPFSIALPSSADPRVVRVGLSPELPADGDGQLVVTVVSLTDTIIQELVLRWPTTINATVFLAPFEPSQQRTREGGPPLWQEWTRWVEGPGESGEPAGTTSLGWGPLLPGATLTIPIHVERRAAGPIGFDLQVLAGEAVLTLESGAPAELRAELP